MHNNFYGIGPRSVGIKKVKQFSFQVSKTGMLKKSKISDFGLKKT